MIAKLIKVWMAWQLTAQLKTLTRREEVACAKCAAWHGLATEEDPENIELIKHFSERYAGAVGDRERISGEIEKKTQRLYTILGKKHDT